LKSNGQSFPSSGIRPVTVGPQATLRWPSIDVDATINIVARPCLSATGEIMQIAILGTRHSLPQIRGGEETVVYELKRQFERMGHEVDVYTPAFRKLRNIDLASTATRTYRLRVPNIPFFYHFVFADKLRKALRNRTYDVILNMHIFLGYRLEHHPHIVRVAEPVTNATSHLRWSRPKEALEKFVRITLARNVEKQILHTCDLVVGVGEHVCEQLRRIKDQVAVSQRIEQIALMLPIDPRCD